MGDREQLNDYRTSVTDCMDVQLLPCDRLQQFVAIGGGCNWSPQRSVRKSLGTIVYTEITE